MTNFGHCKDCKRWRRNNSGIYRMWGTCLGFRDIPGIYVDCDEPDATVRVDTQEDFGCAAFERRVGEPL